VCKYKVLVGKLEGSRQFERSWSSWKDITMNLEENKAGECGMVSSDSGSSNGLL
jgi:hypothetical protein